MTSYPTVRYWRHARWFELDQVPRSNADDMAALFRQYQAPSVRTARTDKELAKIILGHPDKPLVLYFGPPQPDSVRGGTTGHGRAR